MDLPLLEHKLWKNNMLHMIPHPSYVFNAMTHNIGQDHIHSNA